MLFSEIPGLEDIKNRFIKAIRNQQVPHNQLFIGPEGSGNLSLALAYLTYLYCENPGEEDACGSCPSCHKFQKLVHPDCHFVYPVSTTKEVSKNPTSESFAEHWRSFVLNNPYGNIADWSAAIGAENKNPNIAVHEARQVKSTLSLKAFEGRYKSVLLWLPEFMHPSAANALLKLLEEPPEHTVFLLVSNNKESLLNTILSRSQQVIIRPFSDEEIKEYLKSHSGLEDNKAGQIAHLAEGNMHEALRLSGELGDDNHELFRKWMRMCFKQDFTNLVGWAEDFQKMSREAQKSFISYGLNMIRETIIFLFGSPELIRLGETEKQFIEGFGKVVNQDILEMMVRELNQAWYHVERNGSPKIIMMDTSLRITRRLIHKTASAS